MISTIIVFYFCGLLPQKSKILSNHDENIRQIPVEGHSTKYLSNNPQNCQGLRN